MPSDRNTSQNGGIGPTNSLACERGRMGREDRKKQTLELLVDAGIPLPTKVISRAAKYRGATFEESSVRRYLEDLLAEGAVVKVDPKALDDREIVQVGKSDEGYWMASQTGRDRIKSDGAA